MWFWSRWFGFSELVLRIPSIGATLLTVVFTVHLSRILNLRGGSYIIPLVFLSVPAVFIQTFSARPYALALLFSTLSVYSFYLWLTRARIFYGLLYIISSILTFYFHYIFSLVGIVHIAIILCLLKEIKVLWRNIFGVYFLIFIFCIPGFIHIDFWSQKSIIIKSFSSTPIEVLFKKIFPLELLVYVVFGIAMAFIYEKVKVDRINSKLNLIILTWILAPPVILYLLSSIYEYKIFISRYFLWRVSGLALLVVVIFNSLRPKRAWVIILSIWILFGCILESMRKWNIEDWKFVSQTIETEDTSGEIPILLYSGLVELRQLEFMNMIEQDYRTAQYLTAPLRVYTDREKIYPVPPRYDKESFGEYKLKVVDKVLTNIDEFYYVSFNGDRLNAQESFKDYMLEAITGGTRWRLIEEKKAGMINILRFNKIHKKDILKLKL